MRVLGGCGCGRRAPFSGVVLCGLGCVWVGCAVVALGVCSAYGAVQGAGLERDAESIPFSCVGRDESVGWMGGIGRVRNRSHGGFFGWLELCVAVDDPDA